MIDVLCILFSLGTLAWIVVRAVMLDPTMLNELRSWIERLQRPDRN